MEEDMGEVRDGFMGGPDEEGEGRGTHGGGYARDSSLYDY
jgi:hypothetical protein